MMKRRRVAVVLLYIKYGLSGVNIINFKKIYFFFVKKIILCNFAGEMYTNVNV